jgi:hypothetical protein
MLLAGLNYLTESVFNQEQKTTIAVIKRHEHL